MENNISFIDLIGKEFSGSPIGTLAAFIAIFGAIVALMKVCARRNPTSAHEIYQKNGISRFLLFLFAINLPLNKTPSISRTELIGSCLIAAISLSACGFMGNMLFKVANTPKGAASLFYKPTDENFYLSPQGGSEAFAVIRKGRWSITPATCQAPAEMPLTPSHGLVQMICETFVNEEYKQDVIKAVKQFEKDKPVIYTLVTLLSMLLFWIAVSLLLSLIYKKRLHNYVKNEHKIAESYVM